jgi:hypothetical protein
MRRLCRALVLVLVLLAAGCAGGDETKADVLLDRSDVAPLKPSTVDAVSQPVGPNSPNGSQYWACGENEGFLVEDGWKFTIRDLRNSGDNWALFSAVLSSDHLSPADVLASTENQINACNKTKPMYEKVDLHDDTTFVYRSVSPEGRVDTVRAYAVVGKHRLVQLTLLGLNDHSAPEQIGRLVKAAVSKAAS